MRDYKPDCAAQGFAVNRYRETAQSTTRPLEEKDVFVLLALNKLNETNGLFQFLTQSNEHGTDSLTTKHSDIVLDAGDVMIWTGGDVIMFPPGAGGLIMTVRFS